MHRTRSLSLYLNKWLPRFSIQYSNLVASRQLLELKQPQHRSPLKLNIRTLKNVSLKTPPAAQPQPTSSTLPLSSKLDQIMLDSQKILIEDEFFPEYNLKSLIEEEIMVISQILEKMVGTNETLTETKKLYENESSGKLIRGLIVLLLSKSAMGNISNTQWRLAKIVEMINMALLIHKQIRNVGFNRHDMTEAQMNLSNKISVLFGDFLWAKAWKDLSDMGDIEVIDWMVSVLVNTSEGQFLCELESENLESKMNYNYWYEKNFLLAACVLSFGCKSSLKLAGVDLELQKQAYEFGLNFGFFNKAYQEIKWFLKDNNNQGNGNEEPIDMCSLPVIMHMNETRQSLDQIMDIKQTKPKEELIRIIRQGPGFPTSKNILDDFRQKSLLNLKHFPESVAKNYLKNILELMDV